MWPRQSLITKCVSWFGGAARTKREFQVWISKNKGLQAARHGLLAGGGDLDEQEEDGENAPLAGVCVGGYANEHNDNLGGGTVQGKRHCLPSPSTHISKTDLEGELAHFLFC